MTLSQRWFFCVADLAWATITLPPLEGESGVRLIEIALEAKPPDAVGNILSYSNILKSMNSPQSILSFILPGTVGIDIWFSGVGSPVLWSSWLICWSQFTVTASWCSDSSLSDGRDMFSRAPVIDCSMALAMDACKWLSMSAKPLLTMVWIGACRWSNSLVSIVCALTHRGLSVPNWLPLSVLPFW